MSHHPDPKLQSVPLGGLGTGAIEVCADGRFRNLTINNNRTLENRIALAPHAFLAVRAFAGGQTHVRRLQTPSAGQEESHLLSAQGLTFRGRYPQVDWRMADSTLPVQLVWSAFAPVVPYDYDASALPAVLFAVQATNPGPASADISVVMNWQNLCGQSAITAPETLPAISRETLIAEADWDRLQKKQHTDNERRLSARTGTIQQAPASGGYTGEIRPNALVFGSVQEVDGNEDGQHCLATHLSNRYTTTMTVWDPETPEDAARFWNELEDAGQFEGVVNAAVPRCGALCNRFHLQPGETRSVEFVLTWYCPRYVVAGPDEGNFYANTYPDARIIARVALSNGTYYHAAVAAWQQRLEASNIPGALLRRLYTGCEVLSTNSIHTRNGNFGLFESLHDPRVNHLRDRWFWSMGLLLFYPRLELEILDRVSQRMVDPDTQALRVSEGIEGFSGGEFVGPGAAQVEACVHLVTMTYRNFLFGGNLSSIARLAPRIQVVMATILAQDKDVDGFPDIDGESPGLDGAFANGFNVITAGLWVVALRAYERLARRQKFPEADVFKKAYERAARSFDHYFWNREYGYYMLYPERGEESDEDELRRACHVGQLTAIWIANLLNMPDTFPQARVLRVLEAIEAHNIDGNRMHMLSLPEKTATERPGLPGAGTESATAIYNLIRYVCTKSQYAPETAVFDLAARLDEATQESTGPISGHDPERHISQLALWYLVVASPTAQLDLSEKQLNLRPEFQEPAGKRNYTLYSPNGFGTISIENFEGDSIGCRIKFTMDIPQELTAIAVTVPGTPAGIRCALEVEDGPVTVRHAVEPAGEGTSRIRIVPQGKLSTAGFTLRMRESAAGSDPAASRKQWLPQWFRR